MEVKVNKTEVERTYSIGDRFIYGSVEYMLVQSTASMVSFISLSSGNRLENPIGVSDVREITEDELEVMMCGYTMTPVKPKETKVEFESVEVKFDKDELSAVTKGLGRLSDCGTFGIYEKLVGICKEYGIEYKNG